MTEGGTPDRGEGQTRERVQRIAAISLGQGEPDRSLRFSWPRKSEIHSRSVPDIVRTCGRDTLAWAFTPEGITFPKI